MYYVSFISTKFIRITIRGIFVVFILQISPAFLSSSMTDNVTKLQQNQQIVNNKQTIKIFKQNNNVGNTSNISFKNMKANPA